MKRAEDLRMGMRWIWSRPVETLLLVLGVSLGIGATAAGIAMAGRTGAEARKLLASTQYREIVVAARQDTREMDVPAVAVTSTTNVFLTANDLEARTDIQDVQYAYVANMTGFRFGSDPGGPPGMQAGAAASTTASTTASTAAAAQAAPTDMGAPPDGFGGPPPDFQQTPEPAAPEIQPVLEEARGYEVTPEYFTAWNLTAAEGSLFTEADMEKGEPIVVLGSTLAATLFEDGKSLGRQVLSRRELYTIVGILEPTGTDLDTMLFTPAATPDAQGLGGAARMFRGFDTSLHFTVADSTRLEQARAQIQSWFDQKLGAGTVSITVPRYEAEAAKDRNGRLVTVILFLAVSALLIAAANVTNILYARAIRKRRAVGILKALGATVHRVFRLFFLEAGIVGAAGAVVGAGLSVLLSLLMKETMGFGAIAVSFLGLGILGAAAVVTALDIIPALQAARAPAAEAIRYE